MFRSDHFWDWAGEIGIGVLIIAAGIVLTAVAEISGFEELDLDWWKGVGVAVVVAAANYVRSKLPPRSS